MKECNPVSYRRRYLGITLRWSKRPKTLGSFKKQLRNKQIIKVQTREEGS